MRLLIINSSPRRRGNISRLLDRAAQSATAAGADCQVINLYDKDIRYCLGCMTCRSKLQCPIPDDMPLIADAIKAADRIVIGAPCYWANMPGILKNMFDRLVYLFMTKNKHGIPEPLLRGRKALIVTTATTPMPLARLIGQTSGTVKAIKNILKLGGISTIPSIQIGGTLKHDISDADLLRVDRRIARLLK